MLKKFIIISAIVFVGISNVYGKSETIIIEADTLKSNKNKSYEANGNVTLSKDIYKITSDQIIYDNNSKKIFLKSKTKLTDINNNNIFAEEAIISDDMKTGEFKNAGMILNNGISIVAPNITKQDNSNYFLKESDYYFCPNKNLNIDLPYDEIVKQIKKDKFQLFSIHSKKSNLDKEKNKIRLKHVFVKFLNVPVFYLPYITSSRPFNTNVSGLSSPSIHSNNNYGTSIALPFKFYFFENTDIKFEPEIYFKGNILFETLVRYNNKKDFSFDFKLNYAFDNDKSKNFKNDFDISEEDEGKYKKNRYQVNIYTKKVFDNEIYSFANANFISDNYFLRDYFNDYTEILKSNFSILKVFDDNSYFHFETLTFQEIRERKDRDILNTPYSIPNLYFWKQTNITYGNNLLANLDNYATLSSIIDRHHRGYTNFSYYPDLRLFNVFNDLIYVETNISLYLDAFKMNSNKHVKEKDYDNFRAVPEFNVNVEVPVVFFNSLFIKSRVQYIVSDGKNIDNFDFDSKESELTINNLFSSNRYSGYDFIERGNRINYGIDGDLQTKIGNFGFNIGVAYKDKFDDNHNIINFEDNVSDILSGFYYQYENVSLNYLLNIDNKDYSINRQELMLEGSFKSISFDGSYININNNRFKNINFGNKTNDEQINLHIKYNMTDKFSFDFNINDNLAYKKITLLQNSLIYEDGCFKLQLYLKKSGYIDLKENDDISFGFNFSLKNGLL